MTHIFKIITMNKHFITIVIFCFTCSLGLYGQNPMLKSGVTVKKLWMDYQSQNGGSISDFTSYHHGFEIGYNRTLSERLILNVPFKVGVVTNHVQDLSNCLHKTTYGLDGKLQYLLGTTTEKVKPYIMGGIGIVAEVEGESNIQVPLGLGAFIKIRDNAWFNWQSAYRFSLAEDRNNLHHGIGFVYQFGKSLDKPMIEEEVFQTDSDGDGIMDDIDLCPQEIGTQENMGCPDTDGDGVPDFKDDCPNYAGLKSFKGCPDSDGDGIADSEDECPNMAGVAEKNGCPDEDKDGDGIPDAQDSCPNIAGSAENNGCPGGDQDKDGIPDSVDKCPNLYGVSSAKGCPDSDNDGIGDPFDKCPTKPGLSVYEGCPDTDGDGMHDGRDRCPTSPGSVDNNGCPEIAKEDRQVLELAMRAVQFDTGKSSLKPESYAILDQISNIMNRYPDYNLSIEGFTDSVGDANNNLRLSEKRAKACHDYLVSKGISVRKLNFAGFGEANPIADNNLLSGRALNRRVEFNLTPGN